MNNTKGREELKSVLKNKIKTERNQSAVKHKKRKPKVSFGSVNIFHFHRAQGFTTVPSSGGYTLGMKDKHFHEESYTIDEHLLDKRKKRILNRFKDDNSRSSILNEQFVGPDDVRLIDEQERIRILMQAGVQLDHNEREECENIVSSRMRNGCDCPEICSKNICSCWRSGINCQVDRYEYPCSCTSAGCKNPYGRVNFKVDDIQDHFQRTISRLSISKDC